MRQEEKATTAGVSSSHDHGGRQGAKSSEEKACAASETFPQTHWCGCTAGGNKPLIVTLRVILTVLILAKRC